MGRWDLVELAIKQEAQFDGHRNRVIAVRDSSSTQYVKVPCYTPEGERRGQKKRMKCLLARVHFLILELQR